MVYSIDRANLLSAQLEKFTTSYAHHLVGQFANVDFWLGEAKQALAVLADYHRRFTRMRDAQADWVHAHQTVVSTFCPHCGGKCEFDPRVPPPPVRIPSLELTEAARRLRDAIYGFLLRCHRAGMLDEAALVAACEQVGTDVDVRDKLRPLG